MSKTTCANPLKIHETVRNAKDLRKITEDFYKICKGKIPRNTLLCSKCRKLIRENPNLLEKIETSSDSDSSSSHSISIQQSDPEEMADVQSVLKEIGVTPVKKRK